MAFEVEKFRIILSGKKFKQGLRNITQEDIYQFREERVLASAKKFGVNAKVRVDEHGRRLIYTENGGSGSPSPLPVEFQGPGAIRKALGK